MPVLFRCPIACLTIVLLVETFAFGQHNVIDLEQNPDAISFERVIVDKETNQYLGHPTTCLLEDGKTILCVYPKGHGRGAIQYKRSTDGGRTWSKRLNTPDNWTTSKETPTLHRVTDKNGRKRLIMFSGLYPIRMAISENDGVDWTELEPIGDFGGIVAMSSVFDVRTTPGKYVALFHDDGRFIRKGSKQKKPIEFTLFKTVSTDGGMSWSSPSEILKSAKLHLCEPGIVRSPNRKRIACLLRENSRRHPSQVIFSNDEGETWTRPLPLMPLLWGDRHTAKYLPDGRLFISYRCNWPGTDKPDFQGDWVAWVGRFEELVNEKPNGLFIRLKDNFKAADCAYPGVEVLPDGTVVTTTYGHWEKKQAPYILSIRLQIPAAK